jgi:hypothetical protein
MVLHFKQTIMNVEKEFVPYEQALELKELGFDEECFGFYTEEYKELIRSKYVKYPINLPTKPFLAPTFSQAFRWFREKYGYYPLIEMNEQFKKWLSRFCNIDGSICAIGVHSTYEEAEIACLNKLIEIVKNRQS